MTNNNQQVILSDRQQKLRNYHARKIAEKNKKNKTAVDQQQQPTVAATDQENYNGGTSKSNDNIPFINHRGNIKPTNISSSGSSKLSIGKSSSSSKSVGSADIKKMSSTQKAIFMAKRTKKKMSPTSSSASNTTNINSTTNKSKSMTHADTSNNSKQQQEPPSKPHRAIHPFSGTHTKNQLSFNINDRIYLDFNNLSSNGWVWGYMIKASAESSEEGREVREEGKVGGMGAEGRGEVREEDREYGWCPLSYLVEVQPSDIGRDVDKSNIDKKEEIKEKEVKKVRREEEVKSSANTVKTKKPLSTADSKETTTAKMETTSSSSSTTTSRTTTSTTNTNKSTKDDKMKQLFAARRRKAQIEMKNMPLILNSSTVSAGASTIGGESVTSSYSGGEGTNSIDNDTISLCGSVKTLGSSVMDSADGSSKDGSTSDGNSTAKSVGSAKPPKSTYSSRRALDRYLGKKSSSSRGIKNNKSVGGSSVGSSTSTKDTKSTLDGDNDDEEDEDISTLGSTSMDSLDNNHTALSSSSRGGGGAGSGTILSPVREETFFHNSGSGVSSSDLARSSSVSTVLIDNTSSAAGGIVKADTVASSIDEENGTKVMENDSSITGQQHLGESMNDSSNNGILHDRAYSKEDANTNDEHNEEQPPEKSVRFHLSPLEKMQREKEREKAQCSPPRVGSLTLENDDGNTKDSEEVVQQLEVCDDAENDSSHVVESNTRAAHDMVEEDVEFTKFMAALRKEVAGDHKELWSGFQSILGRSPSEQVPLDKSCVVESPTVPKYDENGKKIKKKKIPMDPHTQQSLTTIHRYMVENPRVKNRFMTDSSQLVGDKKLKKERRNQSKGGDKVVEKQQEVVMASSPVRKPASSEAKVSSPIRLRTSPKEESVVEMSKNESIMNSSVHSSSSSKARSESSTKQLSPQKSKKISKPPSSSSSSSTKKLSPTKKLLASVKSRSVSRMNSISSRDSSSRSTASGSSSGTVESQSPKKSLSWRETLKKKQKALKLKHLENDNANESPDESPMVLTLRRVSPRKKQRMAPTSSSPTETESPWSNVQLRTTPKMRESMCSIGQTPNSSSDQPSTISLHPVIQSKGSWNSTSSSTSSWVNVLPPVTDTPKQSTTEPSSTLPSLCCVGDSIDLDALPKRVFPSDEGEAAVFQLKVSEKENDKVVIVGKTAILTAALSSSSTSGTARMASITWWARRSDIRALTLNVEATGATLAHSQGRTPLLFESADVCLEFAQAFYRGPSTKSQEVETSSSDSGEKTASVPTKELSENHKQSSNIEQGKSSSTAGLKNLTEDEESLLDRYRQYSQDERPKLRLTCNSPQGGEPREVEVSLSPLSGGQTALPKKNEDNIASALSEEEEKLASKYRKMLKMGIPPDAVKHKMTSDDIQPKIMNAVLGGGEDKPKDKPKKGVGKQLSDEEEATVSKFRKMMKMGVPADGVRHKMMMEGVDAKLIDAVFDESTAKKEEPTKNTQTTMPKLSSEEEAIANKYRKMLKMGVPLEGVQHKMKQESVDLKIISAIVEEASPASSNDSSADSEHVAKKSKPQNSAKSGVGPTLSEEEEKIASKYRGMLKVCIPKDAVLHKMKQEDVSAKIVEAVLGKEYVTDNGNGGENTATPAKTTNRKTIAFHWTTQNLAPELLERSIFGMKKRKLQSINPEESDIKKLEELFQKRNNNNTAKKKSGSNQDEGSSDMAKILDLTRANNIAISLKAFNDFTFRSLAETINDLDPDCKIVGERVEFIPNLLPSPKEIQAIKKYNGDDDKLITAELFFRQLVPVKRIEDKVKVMKTMSTFEEHVEEARAGFNTLQEVCSQVMESDKLIAVLELVLNIGNVMNTGTLDGGVEAFKFESLSRLSQTKSADGKTTVLDYIVETFIEKGERQSLLLMSEFPDIQDSSRLLIGDLLSDMNTLRKDYKLCKTELASMKRDQSKKKTSSMTKKANVDEGGDPRKALFAAIQSRGSAKEDDSPKQEESSDPRQALFAAIKKKGEASKDDSSPTSSSSSNVKYTPGVHRLSKFLIHSKSILCRAERDQDEAIRACKGLAIYCGEDGGERSAPALLQVLSEFAISLESGVKKYDKGVELAKKQAAAAKKQKEQNTPKKKPQNTPKKPFFRASAFQPHVVGKSTSSDKFKGLNTPADQGTDPMNALFDAIKKKGSQKTINTIPGLPRSPQRQKSQKDKLLADIKSRRQSIPSKPPPDGVSDRVKHINNNGERKQSRVLLVNKMLSDAPESVKQDFLKGVTYQKTDDPLLKKIYEKEDSSPGNKENKKWKPIDPRQELFAAIRNRAQD